jgi:hypothetical protein
MRKSGSRVLESSSRFIISVLVETAVESRWLLLRDSEEGGEPCGRVNIVRNQAEVILRVIEGTQKSTPSREPSTTSASKEKRG